MRNPLRPQGIEAPRGAYERQQSVRAESKGVRGSAQGAPDEVARTGDSADMTPSYYHIHTDCQGNNISGLFLRVCVARRNPPERFRVRTARPTCNPATGGTGKESPSLRVEQIRKGLGQPRCCPALNARPLVSGLHAASSGYRKVGVCHSLMGFANSFHGREITLDV